MSFSRILALIIGVMLIGLILMGVPHAQAASALAVATAIWALVLAFEGAFDP